MFKESGMKGLRLPVILVLGIILTTAAFASGP